MSGVVSGEEPAEAPPRVLALWCADWPVVAATNVEGVPRHRPAAVVAANRVLACSAVARAHGVRRGLRRREAQARCPELVVLAADPERDARVFERVAVAVEALAPGVEVVRPGLLALPARGPVGYFGGTRQAAERLIDEVAANTGVECQIGIADGLFAATLAAHRGVVVEPGRSRDFLGPLSVEELDREPGVDRAELISLLSRLGLRSMGAFGGLPARDVASRFGADAVLAHRLARGLDPRPPARRRPPVELAVSVELDPPVTRVDAAAFASRALAERLHTLLAGHGLACTRLGIQARTLDGVELIRVWRCAEPLTPSGTVDRVRWQLDAWLTRELPRRAGVTSGGIGQLRLSGEEVVAAGALQLGLWGDVGAADERAKRALVRVQAMLGPEGVFTAVLTGGRSAGERVRLVPWGDEREVAAASAGGPRSGAAKAEAESAPWPGRLPAPSPTTVPAAPVPVEVRDAAGRPIVVTERYELSGPPAKLAVDGGRPVRIRAWAGPWPVDQRWWDKECGWRGSHLQVALAGPDGGRRDGPGDPNGDPNGGRRDGPGDPNGDPNGGRQDGPGDPNSGWGGGPGGGCGGVEKALLLLCQDGRWTVAGLYD